MTGPRAREVRHRVLSMPDRFRPGSADGFVAKVGLRIGDQTYGVDVTRGRCVVSEGPPPRPEAKIITDRETWLALEEGRDSSIDAFLDGRLVVRGNVDLAVRFQSLFDPSTRPRRPSDPDHIDVRIDGLTLSCLAFGEGRPVVLLHGLGGTKLSWMPLLGHLAERYRVIAPDFPGHGESSKPRAPYTPAFFASVALGLLDALDVEGGALVGNSLGGRVALEVAFRAPRRVDALALLDPAVPGLRWPYIAQFLRIVPTEIAALPLPFRRRMVIRAIEQLFSDPAAIPANAYQAGADEFIRIHRSARARMAVLASLRGLMMDDEEAFFARAALVRHPTLVVWGQDDRLVSPSLGRRLVRTMPAATFELLPGVGHVPQFEVPGTTSRLVGGFLDAHLGGYEPAGRTRRKQAPEGSTLS